MTRRGIPIAVISAFLGAACVLEPVPLFDRDEDGVPAGADCDDGDPAIGTRFLDRDEDGHGDASAIIDCSGKNPTAGAADDCDDADPRVFPGAAERCNGLDDDCDGTADDGLAFALEYQDQDGDGFGDPETEVSVCAPDPERVTRGDDCDDTDPDVHPDAEEICNGLDDDCDGDIDEGVESSYYPDTDGDGHGRQGGEPVSACTPPDGFSDSHDDCDDTASTVYPGADELCDGVDNDCNGLVDEDSTTTYYQDLDRDGHGDPNVSIDACDAPTGYVPDATDCDDTREDAHPGAEETCNAADDDCDGAIDNDVSIVAMAGGVFHTLALCSDGTVWAWGGNDEGQLGDGTRQTRVWPQRVVGLDSVIAVAAGGYHSLAIRRNDDGGTTVYAWGANDSGQLGDGTSTSSTVPLSLAGLDDVIAVAAGLDFTLVIRAAGTGSGDVWSWGNNAHGQLGDGTTTGRATPGQVPGLNGIRRIRAGMGHALALEGEGVSSGTVWAWGWNDKGQVGDGSLDDRTEPHAIPTFANATAVAAGGQHSLALTSDADDTPGTLWGWGDNTYGQLGDGTDDGHPSPVLIDTAPPFIDIAAGYHHSLGIEIDGDVRAVWTWGSNGDGQLGTGTAESASAPVQLDTLGNPAGIFAGATHSLAIDASDPMSPSAWAWGSNDYGQLGDGTREDRFEPVLVKGI